MITDFIKPITDIVSKFIPDKDKQNQLAHEVATLASKQIHNEVLAQIEVNKAEAVHRSIFVSGWRPSVGWICSIAMGYHFVLQPLFVFVLAATGNNIPDLPVFDMGSMMTVLLGMLGLGGLRTYEKQKGLTK